ncbi:MAG: NAD(P)/FAD-dependent oxidoreductase [Spirochaetota bacterium]
MDCSQRRWHVIVVGAGPAGLFCSLFCGRGTLVLEKGPRACRKLLLTGGGRCNLSHAGDLQSLLSRYGSGGEFLRDALSRFSSRDTAAFFKSRGLPLVTEDDGRMFPRAGGAAAVRDLLVRASREANALLVTGAPAGTVTAREGFTVRAGGRVYRADNLVIAAGGMSYPSTGSTGDGYRIASSLGHTVVEPAPALTPLVVRDHPLSPLAGVALPEAGVLLRRGGRRARADTGPVLLTHRGLSGPAVLDLSRWARAGDEVVLDLAPGWSREELDGLPASSPGAEPVKRMLAQRLGLPERLCALLLGRAGAFPGVSCSQLVRGARAALVQQIKALVLAVEGPEGFHAAMVTRGGVSLREIDPRTMGSRLVPGLFFAGEVMDVDGATGGYNLQAALSTGAVAGMSLASGGRPVRPVDRAGGVRQSPGSRPGSGR